MNVRERQREQERARKWFRALPDSAKWELGDAFVLDTFDWTEWFNAKPSGVFLRAVDDERMYWESEDE